MKDESSYSSFDLSVRCSVQIGIIMDKWMEIKRAVQEIIQEFLTIFSCITILMTNGRYMAGLEMAGYRYMFYIMIFSALGALPSLVLTIHKNCSERVMRIRIVIHFVLLETIIMLAAVVLDIVTGLGGAIELSIEVVLVYLIVHLLSWNRDKKTAAAINEGLRKRHNSES